MSRRPSRPRPAQRRRFEAVSKALAALAPGDLMTAEPAELAHVHRSLEVVFVAMANERVRRVREMREKVALQ